MKKVQGAAILMSAVAAAMAAGCASANENEPTPPLQNPASTAGSQAPHPAAPTTDGQTAPSSESSSSGAGKTPSAGGALGTPQQAGPFQLTLTMTPSPPKVGDVQLNVKATQNGQPVKADVVQVFLSMPTMQMTGPNVILNPAGDRYTGKANLSMAADWEARVTVNAGSKTGSMAYDFKVP